MIILHQLGASSNLILAAMYHDATELATGDIPATTKWKYQEIANALCQAEVEWEMEHRCDIGITTEEHLLLKTADMLELCFFARDQVMLGNKNAHRLLSRGILFVRGLYPDGIPSKVHRLVNQVSVPPIIED
jgi:5'-deoxynucleotidase YfbR-like HD superfamily hydrolase